MSIGEDSVVVYINGPPNTTVANVIVQGVNNYEPNPKSFGMSDRRKPVNATRSWDFLQALVQTRDWYTISEQAAEMIAQECNGVVPFDVAAQAYEEAYRRHVG